MRNVSAISTKYHLQHAKVRSRPRELRRYGLRKNNQSNKDPHKDEKKTERPEMTFSNYEYGIAPVTPPSRRSDAKAIATDDDDGSGPDDSSDSDTVYGER